RELIEEFFEVSEGKTFTILSPKEFVALYKPDIDVNVTEDLKQDEDNKTRLFLTLRKLFNKYDPASVYGLTLQEDEYNSEVREFMALFSNKLSSKGIEILIYDIIKGNFDEQEANNFKDYDLMAKEISGIHKL